MKLDILAIGAHPDDVELGCGGTLLSSIAEGKKVGIVDLTQGELGTRGTVDTRYREALEASKVLGIHARENLKMADGFFVHDHASVLKIITAIRKYQPEILLCNALEDRHPDHGRAGKLVAEAAFLSGLIKIETNESYGPQSAWRPKQTFHYIQDRYIKPSFVVDISPFMEKKLQAILCYATQFSSKKTEGPNTYISTPQFLEGIKARALDLGKWIGTSYGEGFVSEKIIGIRSFDTLVNETT